MTDFLFTSVDGIHIIEENNDIQLKCDTVEIAKEFELEKVLKKRGIKDKDIEIANGEVFFKISKENEKGIKIVNKLIDEDVEKLFKKSKTSEKEEDVNSADLNKKIMEKLKTVSVKTDKVVDEVYPRKAYENKNGLIFYDYTKYCVVLVSSKSWDNEENTFEYVDADGNLLTNYDLLKNIEKCSRNNYTLDERDKSIKTNAWGFSKIDETCMLILNKIIDKDKKIEDLVFMPKQQNKKGGFYKKNENVEKNKPVVSSTTQEVKIEPVVNKTPMEEYFSVFNCLKEKHSFCKEKAFGSYKCFIGEKDDVDEKLSDQGEKGDYTVISEMVNGENKIVLIEIE